MDVLRQSDVAVPDDLRYRLQVNTASTEQTHARVTEVMDAAVRQLRSIQQRVESSQDVTFEQRRANRPG